MITAIITASPCVSTERHPNLVSISAVRLQPSPVQLSPLPLKPGIRSSVQELSPPTTAVAEASQGAPFPLESFDAYDLVQW